MTAPVCTVRIQGEPICGEPTSHTVIGGCMHEHMLTRDVCGKHRTFLLAGRHLVCRRCRLGSDSHMCRVIGREVS